MKDPRLAKLERKLRRRQEKYGVMLKDMAELAGISRQHYGYYARGEAKVWTDVVEKIANSKIFDDDEIKKYSPEPEPEEEAEVEKRTPKSISVQHQRIPNIPNFYNRLNELCDEAGKICVDVNDPRLQELRVAVGGKRRLIDATEFGDELVKRRKELGITQREAAEIAGVKLHIIQNYEYGATRTKTGYYDKIINSPLFEGGYDE